MYGISYTISRLAHFAFNQFSISNHTVLTLNSRALTHGKVTSTQTPKNSGQVSNQWSKYFITCPDVPFQSWLPRHANHCQEMPSPHPD
jgi:hypothetical protein